ncbi:MAG: TlpA family protein disulfide reductase [Alphaproteobacteria bacterium GM202ARS2]|nr:TlpA family protein disulfide reductase [Alphaproteobacteria bacterium GM202ARS2]
MMILFAFILYALSASPLQAQETLPACSFDTATKETRDTTEELRFVPLNRDADKPKAYPITAWKGKVVLINFWATWCPPCIEELPALLALQAQLPDSLQVVAVASDFSQPEALRTFLSSRKLASLWVHHDSTLSLSGTLGIGRMPTTLIVGPQGRLVLRHEGACDWNTPPVHRFIQSLISP